MSKKRGKYYVVWQGTEPGIYSSWDECQSRVKGQEGALYKSFSSKEEAERAFDDSPYRYFKKTADSKAVCSGLQNPPSDRNDTVLPLPLEVKAEALAVDAACSGNPGPMEYRGVYLATGQEIFRFGPIHGTNNVGEFLAIVHALALLKQKELKMPIYSDSRNAILWIKAKKCKTKLERTQKTAELFSLIDRAEKWLKDNSYSTKIIKWETKQWGEVPADFGRK